METLWFGPPFNGQDCRSWTSTSDVDVHQFWTTSDFFFASDLRRWRVYVNSANASWWHQINQLKHQEDIRNKSVETHFGQLKHQKKPELCPSVMDPESMNIQISAAPERPRRPVPKVVKARASAKCMELVGTLVVTHWMVTPERTTSEWLMYNLVKCWWCWFKQ